MKNTLYISLFFVLFLTSFSKIEEETISLTIEVTHLRNSEGVVQFALYNKEGSIPDEDYENYYKIGKGEITKKGSRITFKQIPRGKYAVNILHDENRNGKIDKGWIFPTEGIGFSNFNSIGFTNRPSFNKASFEVKGNKTIRVKAIYF